MSSDTIMKNGTNWTAKFSEPKPINPDQPFLKYRECEISIRSRVQENNLPNQADSLDLSEFHLVRCDEYSSGPYLSTDWMDHEFPRQWFVPDLYNKYQIAYWSMNSPHRISDPLGFCSFYTVPDYARGTFRLPSHEEVQRYMQAAGVQPPGKRDLYQEKVFGGCEVLIGEIWTAKGLFKVVVNYHMFIKHNHAPEYFHQAIVDGYINFNNRSLMAIKRGGQWISGIRGGVDVHALDAIGL